MTGINDLEATTKSIMPEWDYEENNKQGIYPNKISKGSEIKANWHCNICEKKWRAKVYSRVAGSGCPHCAKEFQTSFPEKVLYFYMKQIFPTAVNTYKTSWLEPSEIDIFLPELQLGIEYDGDGYHKDIQKDKKKDALCLQHGIKILHVREPECPPMAPTSIVYLRPCKKEEQLDEMVLKVVNIINDIFGTNYVINPCINNDKAKILELYLSKRKENSISTVAEAMFDWDWSKNEGINPELISKSSNIRVWWKCYICGHSTMGRVADHQVHRCAVCGKISKNSKYYPLIVKHGKKDVKTICPELCTEWIPELNDGLLPENFSINSSKRVTWKCITCGHTWINAIYNRTNGQGCPVCKRKNKVK